MSGHNRWSSIKHKKGAADAKRGKIFTKISKELTVAARMGGGDPAGNARLRLALSNARAASMPSDTVQRAIKKGTGELEGGTIEELSYEGYGPQGVGFIIEVATDNTNRSLGEIRNILEKNGGSFAKSGAVAFNFQRRGVISYDAKKYTEEKVMEAGLDAGADDVVTEGESIVVYTAAAQFHQVKEGLDKAGLEAVSAELSMVPQNTVVLADEESAKKVLKLLEKIEDQEDVQNVWGNFEIPDDVMRAMQGAS